LEKTFLQASAGIIKKQQKRQSAKTCVNKRAKYTLLLLAITNESNSKGLEKKK
jgi:hypothetical protein